MAAPRPHTPERVGKQGILPPLHQQPILYACHARKRCLSPICAPLVVLNMYSYALILHGTSSPICTCLSSTAPLEGQPAPFHFPPRYSPHEHLPAPLAPGSWERPLIKSKRRQEGEGRTDTDAKCGEKVWLSEGMHCAFAGAVHCHRCVCLCVLDSANTKLLWRPSHSETIDRPGVAIAPHTARCTVH